MSNNPTTVPVTFADLVKLQPRLALLERDCLEASKVLRVRQRDWYWYTYAKPRLNDLVGFEPRPAAEERIPLEIATLEAHTLAYRHLYSLLHAKKKKARPRNNRGRGTVPA